MPDHPETPIQEAISLLTIVAILLGVGCYLAAVQNVPVLSSALFGVASMVYAWFPALGSLKSPQIPYLVAAATIGGVFWILGLGLAPLLARLLNAGQLASLERQTGRLKRNRARIAKARRARDNFDVS